VLFLSGCENVPILGAAASDNYREEKMEIRLRTWVLTLVCYSFSLPVMANDLTYDNSIASDFHRYYNSHISLNIGQSRTLGTCATTLAEGASCKESGGNFRIAYGHHFTPAWGMEISYGDFGKGHENGVFPATPPLPDAEGSTPYTWKWDAIGWEIAGTGSLFIGKSFSLVGKVGFLRANIGQEIIYTHVIDGSADSGVPFHRVAHDASNNLSAGIGAQYDFNRDYAARLQFEYFGKLGSVTKIKTGALSACILLKF
jgi:hypothetical protein